MILCEVLEAIRSDQQFNRVRAERLKFQLFETGGEQLGIAAARNFRRIRERGRTVRKTIDCLIATFCLANAHTLLHGDHHFDVFEQYLGLAVLHP